MSEPPVEEEFREFMPEPVQRRRRLSRSVFVLPSIFTVGNIFCGYYAILLTMYGGFDAASIEEVRRYFGAGRTILQSLGLETYPPADPYRVRALSVTDTTTTEALRVAIDRAARERSWLVLVFHQFSNAAAQHDTEYSGVDFARVMAHLAAADVEVLTFSEATLGR